MSILPRKCTSGHLNPPQAKFCGVCGQVLDSDAPPALAKNAWVRQAGDIAARVDASDLKGLFMRGLIVEPGTTALLVDGGAVKGLLQPGTHNMDNLEKRLRDWLQTGIGSQVAALLVSIVPLDLEFNAGGVFTSDPIGVGVRTHVQVEIKDPGVFAINMLRGRDRFTQTDLTGYLYPQVSSVIDSFIHRLTVQQLADDLSLKDKLELALVENLAQTFGQAGLQFNFVRALEFNLEHLDKIKGVRSRYALQVSEGEAELQGRTSIFKLMREGKLLEWAQETAKVEDEERKLELYERMRQAVMAGKMQEVRSVAEYEAFLDGIDRGKLLREKERDELLRSWKEAADDHNLARAFLLEKLRLEQGYQLEKIRLIQTGELDNMQLEAQILITRKKTDFEIENRRKFVEEEFRLERDKLQLSREKAKTQLEIEDITFKMRMAQERDKGILGIELLAKMKEVHRIDDEEKLRMAREDRLKIAESDFTREAQRFEMNLRQIQFQAEMAYKQTQLNNELETNRINADKEMSPDQLLARNTATSEAAARAMEERARAEATIKANEAARERELNEQARRDHEAELKRQLDANEKAAERLLELSRHTTDKMSDMGQAFAHGSGGTPPIIVTGAGGPGQVIQPSTPIHASQSSPDSKNCPECAKPAQLDAKFCPHCGHKFAGM